MLMCDVAVRYASIPWEFSYSDHSWHLSLPICRCDDSCDSEARGCAPFLNGMVLWVRSTANRRSCGTGVPSGNRGRWGLFGVCFAESRQTESFKRFENKQHDLYVFGMSVFGGARSLKDGYFEHESGRYGGTFEGCIWVLIHWRKFRCPVRVISLKPL